MTRDIEGLVSAVSKTEVYKSIFCIISATSIKQCKAYYLFMKWLKLYPDIFYKTVACLEFNKQVLTFLPLI